MHIKGIIEDALNLIHRTGAPLNPTSLQKHVNQLAPDITQEQVFTYMQETYGWNRDFCFDQEEKAQ